MNVNDCVHGVTQQHILAIITVFFLNGLDLNKTD